MEVPYLFVPGNSKLESNMKHPVVVFHNINILCVISKHGNKLDD